MKDSRWLDYVWGINRRLPENFAPYKRQNTNSSQSKSPTNLPEKSKRSKSIVKVEQQLSQLRKGSASFKVESTREVGNCNIPIIEIKDDQPKKPFFESPIKNTDEYFKNISPANLLSPDNTRIRQKLHKKKNTDKEGPSSPTSSVGTKFYMNMMDEEEDKMEEDEDFYVQALSTLKLQKQQTLPSNPIGLPNKKPIKLAPRARDSLDDIDEVSSKESGEFE